MTEPQVVRAEGAITDAGVARLRARIGVPEPHPVAPRYLCPNEDAFRHVAHAYGDDNPLWFDPSYAAETRWKAPIAPPLFVGGDSLIGVDEVANIAEDQRALMRGDPLRGAHAFYSGSYREWWAPLYAGRRVRRRNALIAVLDKQSDFAKRAIHEWSGQVFQEDGGPVLSGQYKLMIRVERDKAQARQKYEATRAEPYTAAQLAEIDAQYEREVRRGAGPRWFEDVREGELVGPLVKGPLTVTDMVCWHAGVGMGLYGVAALRLGYQNRRRIPRFYEPDELGIPDAMQRCHWDPAYARKAGNPTTYDYGRMREAWLIHLCTDWMGDDAWLWKLDCQFNRFNFVGDTHWLQGRVVKKYLAEGERPAVDLELEGKNQRGELTTPGHATILLPSRAHGPVRLPDPPARDLKTTIDALAERFARE